MNLRSLDLNLLVVLDALLDECHVTRAADRLALSQPATSNALDRCRYLFDDPLLERVGRTMRLTTKAQTLRVPLKAALAQVRALVDDAPPALDTLSQVVRIAMADIPAALLLPDLQHALSDTAPGIDLVVPPWHGAEGVLAQLRSGEIDLALSMLPQLGPEFRRHELLREGYRVAMRKGHPAARNFDLDRWLAHPHILISGRGDRSGPLDDALARLGRERRVGLVLPSFMMALPVLRESNFICLLPESCRTLDAATGLVWREPPVPIESVGLHLAWHLRRDTDVAVQHVAGLIRSAIAQRQGAARRARRSAV